MRPPIRLSLVPSLALAIAGCGGPANKPMTAADMEVTKLNDVAELYRIHQVTKSKPPMKVTDLAPFEPNSPMGMMAIRSDEIVVRLGATLPDTSEGGGTGPADEVLAYEAKVPESGGQVLMLNRTIKTMTPEEFKAARLAGTTSTAVAEARDKTRKK